MSKRDYSVLVSFAEPVQIRCRLANKQAKNWEEFGFPIYKGVAYLPVFNGSKARAEKMVAKLRSVYYG